MTTYGLALRGGQHIPLTAEILRIGRMPLDPLKHASIADLCQETARLEGDCLSLPDPFVSRQHAVITRTDEGTHAIADSGSRCGTYVNGCQIKETTLLKAGDQIKIGQSDIEYRDPSYRAPEPPPWLDAGSD